MKRRKKENNVHVRFNISHITSMNRGSREELLGSSQEALRNSQHDLRFTCERPLTRVEKTYLLHADRGDYVTVKRLIEQNLGKPEVLDINCVDPLNRSALIAAIENENIELIKLLLGSGIKVKDALLHAIKEEYVEAVELLLQWEEEHYEPGEPYSWESVDSDGATFTPDITPLILAAHRNHYEILKILLDRGATLPVPHDVKCGCDECVKSSQEDSLRHSQARINAYRALSSPSLIALSSADPLLTAFQLSWELGRLSRMETEFRVEYKALRQQCQEFATSLLDHTRTSKELEIMLNYNPWDLDCWEPGERQTLGRLKLAIKYKQKMFVAHPNVQQLLGAIWYEGLPGFKRKNIFGQCVQVAKLGVMFPVYCTIYMLAPNSEYGRFMKKPFVKFICHSSSYMLFLTLLSLASQRAEYVVLEWSNVSWLQELVGYWKDHERGSLPGVIEFAVIIYIASLIWAEIRALWTGGLTEYISDLWNIVDFITNMFYIAWISLRISSWYIVQRDHHSGLDPWYPRERWDSYDPMLLSEGAFAAGMIFSFLKLVHIFSINPYLGPLQVSLGRMILDILKFFFVYMLVLFAFGCGLNQLMWYYAELEKDKCYHLPNGLPDFDGQERACSIWRRYANLFETSQSLFWASFGLVDLTTFELTGIKSFTRFWALLTFGSYSVINIIVLLNMLIAMMSNSYQIISERADTEWKFARSNLWMSYFEDGDTVPPPFNIIPTPKHFFCWIKSYFNKRERRSILNKSREKARQEHEAVMRILVRRYVTAEQRARDEVGVTEDDVMEIRQDISTLRYELIDILHNNGMKTPRVSLQDTAVSGKKGKVMERRILKDFQIGIVEGIIKDVISKENKPKDVFSQIAKAIVRRSSTDSKKRDWNALVRTNTVRRDPIGTAAEAEIRRSRQSLRAHILENVQSRTIDPQKLLQYNPKLSELTPTTRVAYAKFMRSKLRSDFSEKERNKRKSDESSLDGEDFNDEVLEAPQRHDQKRPVRSFRSRTPIPEMSDDEGLRENEITIEVDVEDQDTDSIKTKPLKIYSGDHTEPNTPSMDGNYHHFPSPESQDHVIQIEPDTPTKNLLLMKEEERNLQDPTAKSPSLKQNEQILSASALESQYTQASSSRTSITKGGTEKLPYKSCLKYTNDTPKNVESAIPSTSRLSRKDSKLVSASLQSQMAPSRFSQSNVTKSPDKSLASSKTSSPKSLSPRSPRVVPSSPTPSIMSAGKGKSKATGRIVSGWL
ncbi:transient receptor potential protein isoform X2 [Bombyx mori]|uniref:Transient receptor ion channel domain-containing protein n=1 Tax=Bombyx mori TaxID=7091 RepID=A0A8R2DN53_BOMMO|nr:transient receptor potential protein isoform X2 [Bombyx mori]